MVPVWTLSASQTSGEVHEIKMQKYHVFIQGATTQQDSPKENTGEILAMSLSSQVPEYHVASVSFTSLRPSTIQSPNKLSKDSPKQKENYKAITGSLLSMDTRLNHRK